MNLKERNRQLLRKSRVEVFNERFVKRICLNCERFEKCLTECCDGGKLWCWRGYMGMIDFELRGIGIICEMNERGVIIVDKDSELKVEGWYFKVGEKRFRLKDVRVELEFERV